MDLDVSNTSYISPAVRLYERSMENSIGRVCTGLYSCNADKREKVIWQISSGL